MERILTKEELQRDIADLLDYLHTTPEQDWDMQLVRRKIMDNIKRFNHSIMHYHTPIKTEEFMKLIYSKVDASNLIQSLTDKYVAIDKLVPKE